ncbi:unnamed protein product [Phytomonas sp. Hart1]|nr:unnamed protein product [Phytomonas sp. Hart1]|eukprot:CCW68688.1 unnamed protein product [Phytomonas sp. isolate Hart1]
MNCAGKIPLYYERLGVHPSISAADLSRCYKKLSLELHPDRVTYRSNTPVEADRQRYQQITEAYNVLSDPSSRAAYDTRHGVNFHARLSALRETITSHNTGATRPLADRGARRRDRSSDSPFRHPSLRDEDYDPEDSTTENNAPEDYSTEDYAPEDYTLEDYAPADPTRPPRAFALERVGLAQPQGRYSSATVRHAKGNLKSNLRGNDNSVCNRNDNDNSKGGWGLLLCGDILLSCPSHAAVPFPARVVQVDGRAWRRAEGGPLPSCDGVDELQLTLLYDVEVWRLVGDFALLRDPAVLDGLVPPGQIVSALPSLGMNASVLTVNGTPVSDANELRHLLGSIAAEGSLCKPSKEPLPWPLTVTLECVTLEGPTEGE